MSADQIALDAKGKELFAGIPVSDFDAALDWYRRLFGSDPSFFPNAKEAVWAVGDHRWIYIIVEPERAGGSIQTIMCDDLEPVIAGISNRGLEYNEEEFPAEGVRKVMYHDPDGNQVGIGQLPPE